LALRDLLVNMKDEGLDLLGLDTSQLDGLRHAQQQLKDMKPNCYLPQPVESSLARKPLCLVQFGNAEQKDKHPPPDPLLLAYKAAVVWSKMTQRMRMLSNGEKADSYYDDDMSEWDDGYVTSPSWKELAVGLGQPNGYQLDDS
jgi:hypothetical protein